MYGSILSPVTYSMYKIKYRSRGIKNVNYNVIDIFGVNFVKHMLRALLEFSELCCEILSCIVVAIRFYLFIFLFFLFIRFIIYFVKLLF